MHEGLTAKTARNRGVFSRYTRVRADGLRWSRPNGGGRSSGPYPAPTIAYITPIMRACTIHPITHTPIARHVLV